MQNGAPPGQIAAMHENTSQRADALIDGQANGCNMPGAAASPPGAPDEKSNRHPDTMTPEQTHLHHRNGNGSVVEPDKQDHACDAKPNGESLQMCSTDQLAEAQPDQDGGDAASDASQPLQSALLRKVHSAYCAIKRVESQGSAER